MVRCPLIASTAIFPFRSALYCFRCLFFFMCLHGRQQFYTLAVCLNFGEYRHPRGFPGVLKRGFGLTHLFSDLSLEPVVLGQSYHVVEVMVLTPAEQLIPAKTPSRPG